MKRVFWDTMLFVYLLEWHPTYGPLVQTLLARSYERGDILLTSWLALGEMLAGMPSGSERSESPRKNGGRDGIPRHSI